MRLAVIKHVPFEGPGRIAAWAQARGHAVKTVELAYGQALPEPESFDGLVLMGGPMSVHDTAQHAWILPEQALIRESLAQGKQVLGICLGAQQMAAALGAAVGRNPEKEIGWFPIEAVPGAEGHAFWQGQPRALQAFHWHGETFALPSGAQALLRSAACEQQGFALGRQGLALQCHLEVDEGSLRAMVENGRDELDPSRPFIQSEPLILAQTQVLAALKPRIEALLDAWAQA